MGGNEAPAATGGGIDGMGSTRETLGWLPEPASHPDGPISFVAVGLGSAGICDKLAALQHTSCVPASMK
jgi:hypothetical protein